MNQTIASYAGWLLLLCAVAFYAYGIIEAIRLSGVFEGGTQKIDYPPILYTTIGTMQTLLLTNMGVLLGISVADPNSNIARAMKLSRPAAGIALAPPPPMDLKDKIKLFALVLFIVSLIACFICWAVNKFSDSDAEVVLLIPETGKMFVGAFLAYITALLR